MKVNSFEVIAEKAFDEEDRDTILVKLAMAAVEVNIHLNPTSLHRLISFHGKNQDYCLAGESADSPVHRKRGEEGEVYILIGQDQETWDVGLTVCKDVLDKIVAEIHPLLSEDSQG